LQRPQKQTSSPPAKHPADSKQKPQHLVDSKQKQQHPVDSKQQFPPSSLYPVDSKQQLQPPPQHPNPAIYYPRPHKKSASTSSPDNFYPRPSSSSGRPSEPHPPNIRHTSSNQYLRPVGPKMPGAWPEPGGRSPSPTPPAPGYVPHPQENGGDQKPQRNVATIAHGASTVVHGFLGLISSVKTK